MELDPVFAPRREKYTIQTNTLVHFSSELKSQFINYHREALGRYAHQQQQQYDQPHTCTCPD